MRLGWMVDWLQRRPVVLNWVLGVAGVLLIVVGVLGIFSSNTDRATLQSLRAGGGTMQTGTLVDTVTKITDEPRARPDRVAYCPRYSYAGGDGVQRTLVDHDGCESSKSRLVVGSTVKILVDSDDPSVAFIDERDASVGRTSSAIFSWSTLALGIFMAGSVPFSIRRRRLRAARRASYEASNPGL